MELEIEVHEVKTLLAQQMAKFDGLEQKFNLLLTKFAEQDNPQPQKQSMQRKRKSDKTLVKNSGSRRIHTSDAGTTTPTAEPPDPTRNKQANLPLDSTHPQPKQDHTAPMENSPQHTHDTASDAKHIMDTTEDNTLEGGIQDDDLSEHVLQQWEDPTPTNSRISISPEDSRKKID